MNFSEALELLKQSKKLCRKGWNGVGLFVTLTVNPSITDEIGANHHQYLNIENFMIIHKPFPNYPSARYTRNTWIPSIGDLLANDWEEV